MLAGLADGSGLMQSDIVRAFGRGEVEDAPGPVVRIDTPLNHIFLAGRCAYKLKRAIETPFVDFRNRPARRHACEAELAKNRALGSPLYQGVRGIFRSGGKIALGPCDDADDWVVVMERFDADCRFDVLARAGRLTTGLAEQTTARILRAHLSAAPVLNRGHAADYRAIIRGLRRTEQAGAEAQDVSAGADNLYSALDVELARIDPLIEERRARGKVRMTHADLHLSNICLIGSEPVLFDALEFDDRLATTDVLYDLAFFLMDLQRYGLHAQANAAMNHYWNLSGEAEQALTLLPFFMALRAAVRMAVSVSAGALEAADRYRRLGLRLLSRSRPVVIAIGGLSGSGKSAIAREIAGRLPGAAGARVVRTDVLRKHAYGVGLLDPVVSRAFASSRRSEIYRDALAHVHAAVRAGASVILDATFELQDTRETFETVFPQAHKVWLDVPLATRLTRIEARCNDASDADAAVARAQEPPIALAEGWRRIDASRDLEDVLSRVLQDLPVPKQ